MLDPKEQFTNNADIKKYAACKRCVFRAYKRNPTGDYRRASCAMFPYPEIKPQSVYNGEPCSMFADDLTTL